MAVPVPGGGGRPADPVHRGGATGQGGIPYTVMFVSQVLELPVKPQAWFSKETIRHEVHYQSSDGTTVADVYRPNDDRQHAAVVLFLGANAAGRDDEDVVNLGHALAGAGYVVMFHWSPTMALRANIEPAETGNLVSAYRYLVGTGIRGPGTRWAWAGSAWARPSRWSPRLIPSIRDDVYFVNAFGPLLRRRNPAATGGLTLCRIRRRAYAVGRRQVDPPGPGQRADRNPG